MQKNLIAGAARITLVVALTISVILSSLAIADGPQYLSPEIHEALRAKVAGNATPRQEALLFANNDAINRARLARQIPDKQYQAAQEHFKQLNQEFAADAAKEAKAGFEVQKSKSTRSQPGTDSDYITDVDSPDQIKQMQQGYNRRVNDYLQEHEVISADRDNWHNKLDTDFMANPKNVKRSEFEQVSLSNNDAYQRPEAADWEYKSRNPKAGPIRQRETVEYDSEMEDFRNKKKRQIEALKAKGVEKGTLDEGKLIQKQAQQQKYDSRIGDADARYRQDHGLSAADNPTHDLARLGANREPDVSEDLARELLGKKPGETLSPADMDRAQRQLDSKRQAAFGTEQNIYQNAKRSMAKGVMEKAQLDSEVDQWMRQNGLADPNVPSGHSKQAARDAAQIMENMSPSEKGRFMSEVEHSLPKDPRTGDLTPEGRQLMSDLRNEMARRPGAKPALKQPDLGDVAVLGKPGSKVKVKPIDGGMPKKGGGTPMIDGMGAVEAGVQMGEATARQLGKVLDRDDKSVTARDVGEIIGEGTGYTPMRQAIVDTRLRQQMQKIELQNRIKELEGKPGPRTAAEQAEIDRLKTQVANTDTTASNLQDLGNQMLVEPNKEIASRRWQEMEAQAEAEGRKPEFLRDGIPAMANISAEVVGNALGMGAAANTAAEMDTYESRAQWSEQQKAMVQQLTHESIWANKRTQKAVAELESILNSGQPHTPENQQRIKALLGEIDANQQKMNQLIAIADRNLAEVDPKKLATLRGLAGAHPDPQSMADYARQMSEEARSKAAKQAKLADEAQQKKQQEDDGWGSAESGYGDEPIAKALTSEEALTERITEIMLSEPDPQKRKALIREAIREHGGGAGSETADQGSDWGDGGYEQVSPAERYVSAITAANDACEYQRALALANEAHGLDPDHPWLSQNYPTIQLLAQRDQAYRRAIGSAIDSLEQGQVSGSIGSLKTAMQNASTHCGQDDRVRGLLQDAKQIAKLEREAVIDEARREGARSAWERDQARARLERDRAERRRSAAALRGALMGALGAVNQAQTARSSTAGSTSSANNGDDIFDRMAKENERKYGGMMEKYRESQSSFTAPKGRQTTVSDQTDWQTRPRSPEPGRSPGTPPPSQDGGILPPPGGGILPPSTGGYECTGSREWCDENRF
ncbi:MAG: hypothetical protein JAY61_09700 [Candidatus Thiodiazotropha taylori]|nr:hypothetical protein [Candidatus Thiodiazotropha taylori]